MKARLLYFDIETAPLIGSAWQTWDTNLIWVIKEWYLLSFSWMWEGESKPRVLGLWDFKLYKEEPENDRELITELHKLFSQADIVVAHNGDRFDIKKVNARIVFHGLPPPEPSKSIDTLKIARRNFGFTSNKLNDLGIYLGCGQKLETGGYDLWRKVLAGDSKAQKKMLKYNIQDVRLLREVYMKLRPWDTQPAPLNTIKGEADICPKCGKGPLHKRGMAVTKTNRYQRVQCQDCGGWSRERLAEKGVKVTYV